MPTQVAQDRLGDHLVSEGLITELQLREALTDARDHNTRVGFALVKLGFIAEEEITRMLARQYRVPAVDLDRVTVEEKIARLIPGEVAFKHLVLPLRRVGRTLTVAMANPSDLGAIDDVKFITRLEVEPVVVGEFTLRKHLEKYYDQADDRMAEILSDLIAEDVEFVEDEEEDVNMGVATGAGGTGSCGEVHKRAPDRRREQGRQRHPHRAFREGSAGPLPDRRSSRGGHEAAHEDEGGADLSHQDPG
jgi:hypothetical protein